MFQDLCQIWQKKIETREPWFGLFPIPSGDGRSFQKLGPVRVQHFRRDEAGGSAAARTGRLWNKNLAVGRGKILEIFCRVALKSSHFLQKSRDPDEISPQLSVKPAKFAVTTKTRRSFLRKDLKEMLNLSEDV